MVRPMKRSEIERKRNFKTGVRVRNSKTRKKNFHLTPRQIFLIVFMLLVFMGSGIGYVWSNFEGTQIGYNLSHLQNKQLQLKELNKKLRLELATLKSPQHLEGAISGMGLRTVTREQIILLP